MTVQGIYTKSLLHFDSSATTDETGKTWTNSGAGISNTYPYAPKFGSYCLKLDTMSDYITCSSSDFNFGTENWTIDFWAKIPYGISEIGTQNFFLANLNYDSTNKIQFWYRRFDTRYTPTLSIQYQGNTYAYIENGLRINMPTDSWIHFAGVRSGNTLYFFFNGALHGTSSLGSDSLDFPNAVIGNCIEAVDEFRISKGIARWTSNFTPPSSAYSNPPSSFTKSSPSNGATNTNISQTIDWGDSSGMSSYDYAYGTSSTPSNWTSSNTTSQATLSNLNYNTKYYWHVRAVTSEWYTYSDSLSSYWNFTTTLGAFSKVSPENGSIKLNPKAITLDWGNSTGVEYYEYAYGTSASPTNWTSSETASFADLPALEYNTIYYWRVRARSTTTTVYADASESSWSFKTKPREGGFDACYLSDFGMI